MDFQAVVLAGGIGKQFGVLTDKSQPKALLPVGNRPLLSYSLEALEKAGFADVLVVTAGDDTAKAVSKFAESYTGKMQIQVVPVAEDAGTATALRSIMDRLTSNNLMVLSGDLITDVSLAYLAGRHCASGATATVLLAPCRENIDSETGKPAGPVDFIGLDANEKRLLFCASASAVGREIKVRRSVISHNEQVALRADLFDTHLYLFSKSALETLDKHPNFTSLKEHLVPYLARRQFAKPIAEKPGEAPVSSSGDVYQPLKQTCGVFVEVADQTKYTSRVCSLAGYSDANREVSTLGEAAHLTGHCLSQYDNVVDASAQLGQRATVGPACIVGERVVIGDKSSIKRSVIGPNTRLGNNVKVMSSVIGDNVTIEDGCHIQNSIVCSNAVLQERCSLRDCQVAATYMLEAGLECRSEALSM